ncbi:MAG: hypothetical protein LKM32_04480 [Chiayiivirga sp.]|jgi:hypothetical protein|uniref:hypothetical protein n=1 Tax=Chiayiivirga sp. TaxID=2041042 RepID=UPI0025C249D5|nr:hypothetical protein [Chiayiivirga sp.]MCI1728671.1 hypothetical protein [Chiayiivirga sp.]
MSRPLALFPILLLALAMGSSHATEWTYRGTLSSYGKASEGVHVLRLTPYADASGGKPLAPSLGVDRVEVVDGRFAVDLDFPDRALQSGEFWLAVEVARPGEPFHALPERQYVNLKQALSVCWDTLGNAATNPGTNFIGTLDAAGLALRVNNVQAGRIEPSINTGSSPPTPNLVFGAMVNSISFEVQGGTIGGGGRSSNPTSANRVFDDFGTIAGGLENRVGTDDADVIGQNSSTVGGGFSNEIDSSFAVIAGGRQNNVSGSHGSVGGGQNNDARGPFSTIPGGLQATTTKHGQVATASGGFSGDFGSAQSSTYVMRNAGTGSRELFLDGATQRLSVAPNQSIAASCQQADHLLPA